MSEPVGTAYQQPAARPRFGVGLVVGIAIGLLVIVPIGAVAGVMAFTALGTSEILGVQVEAPAQPVVVKTVKSDEAWLSPDASGRGTVSGWTDGVGDDTSPGAGLLGSFELEHATEQGGVVAGLSLHVWVTKTTKLLRDGKPWKPTGDRMKGKTPGEYLASTFATYDADDYLTFRDVTVTYHTQGGRLIADTINASADELDPPDELW